MPGIQRHPIRSFYFAAAYSALLICALLTAAVGTAAPVTPYFEYSKNCSKAYLAATSMHFDEARAALAAEAREHPGNLMAVYIADYEDCVTMLLNCDPVQYTKIKGNMDARLQQLRSGNPSSPWYRLTQAGIYLHWALISTRMGEDLKAGLRFHKSFGLLVENRKRFPEFEYNNIFSGLQNAVIGSVPGSYKFLASVFGMRGNLKEGVAQLGKFISTHEPTDPLYTETVLYYSFTRFYLLSEQEQVWTFLNSPQFTTNGNLLHTFAKATIALDYRKAPSTIAMLSHPEIAGRLTDYPIFLYQMGMAQLSTHPTVAVRWFADYNKYNKSTNYIKDTWQKMAYAWYIAGNMEQATKCRLEAGKNGTTRLDADKQAQKFAESTVWPLKPLLEARLLIDGGYFSEAEKKLVAIAPAALTNPADKAEYHFRFGRVQEAEGEYKKALANYQEAINVGKDRHEQFAARAALQMGRVYELLNMPTVALTKYEECLDMPSHDFQNAIDHMAKAGISRISGN